MAQKAQENQEWSYKIVKKLDLRPDGFLFREK
jgi:hypothetical protein